MMILRKFEENHRETALLGADPGAFLPVADLTKWPLGLEMMAMVMMKLMMMTTKVDNDDYDEDI